MAGVIPVQQTAYRSYDQRPIVRDHESSSAVVWRPNTCHEVERILTDAIEEVVLKIPHGGLVEVVESAFLRAFSSPCVIGLKGTGSAVCL